MNGQRRKGENKTE